MSIEIFMPALSPTMEKGTLAKWLVKEGDSVSSGDVIAEIETDKATMEVESIDDGTVAKILVSEGTDDVPVGQIIAVLAEEGEDVASIEVSDKPEVKETPQPEVEAIPTPVNGQITDAVTQTNVKTAASDSGSRVKASPLARRIAKDKGLDLASIKGSGPYGRIVKKDVEAADVKPAIAAQPAVAAAPLDAPYQENPLSNMRKTIARRLSESKQQVPHFYLTIDCELDKLLSVRKEANAALESDGIKLSVNDFIIKAVGMALKKVPAANVQYAGDKMYWFERADVSVAVAIEGGLITPVIRGACSKGLAAISEEMKELAGKAKVGKLAPEDYAGGTFSVSNLGMFGIKAFDAVINPPQGAIMAIGAGEQRPVVKDGIIVPATVMSCTLSCDHRAIDGAVGAEFLAAFKGYIEAPVTMMV